MVTTYFLRERRRLDETADSTILRIIDRKTVLIGTAFGCVYISREDAARVLRTYRRRASEPFVYQGKQAQFMEYEKSVTL